MDYMLTSSLHHNDENDVEKRAATAIDAFLIKELVVVLKWN